MSKCSTKLKFIRYRGTYLLDKLFPGRTGSRPVEDVGASVGKQPAASGPSRWER